MTEQTLYLAQAFEKRGKRLHPGQPIPARSADAARLRADRGAERIDMRTVGWVALQQTVDTETGEILDGPHLLARHGELPREIVGDD